MENANGLLEIAPFGWDATLGIHDEPIYIGWLRGKNGTTRERLVAWPRGEEYKSVDLDELIDWNGTSGPTWDISIREYNVRNRDEIRVRYCGTIFRNRKKFLEHWYNSRDFAWNDLNVKLSRIEEHPLEFKSDTFAEDMAGRKVWFNDQPGVIDHWLGSDDLRLIIVPEEGTEFSCPKQFLKEELENGNDPDEYYEDGEVVTTIFDPQVWWFRDDDAVDVLQRHLELCEQTAKNGVD